MMGNAMRRLTMMGVATALLFLLFGAPGARAFEPVGACCFTDHRCEQLIAIDCEGQNGRFIGVGTSCQEIDCAAPVAAPVLSIAGLVAALGALTALGLRRLIVGRRRH